MRRILGLASTLVLRGLVALTLARFVTTGSRWPILLATFSSYALPGFGLVLVGCALAARRARRRGWIGLVAGLSALGLVVQVWAVVPRFVGGSSDRSDLTVMTANLEFGRGDPVTVVRTVAAEHVDVLVLAEVTPDSLQRLGAAGLTELLPHRAGTPATSASGTMVFSRYRLGTDHGLFLGNGGLDLAVDAPQPLRLLAVHTAQPVGAPRPWLADLATVRDRAAAAVAQGPVLAVGDFNASLDHQPLRGVLGAGLRDAAEQAGSGWQPTWPTRWRESWLRPFVTLDHVLVSRHYDASRTRTVAVPRTDHLALVARLTDRR